MALTTWLVDESAYVRMQAGQAANIAQWNSRIERGLLRLSTVTRLELGSSARSGEAGRTAFGLPPLSLMPIEHLTPAVEDRAFEVLMLLADRGQHRAPPRTPSTWPSTYLALDAPGAPELLQRLGKHRASVACLYVNKLADIDLDSTCCAISSCSPGRPSPSRGAAADGSSAP